MYGKKDLPETTCYYRWYSISGVVQNLSEWLGMYCILLVIVFKQAF